MERVEQGAATEGLRVQKARWAEHDSQRGVEGQCLRVQSGGGVRLRNGQVGWRIFISTHVQMGGRQSRSVRIPSHARTHAQTDRQTDPRTRQRGEPNVRKQRTYLQRAVDARRGQGSAVESGCSKDHPPAGIACTGFKGPWPKHKACGRLANAPCPAVAARAHRGENASSSGGSAVVFDCQRSSDGARAWMRVRVRVRARIPSCGLAVGPCPGRSLRRVVVPMLVGCLREMASLSIHVGSYCTVSMDVRPPGGWRCAHRSPARAPSCSSQAFSSRRRAEHSTTREAHRNRMGAASARERRRAGLCVCALPGAGCPSHLELDRRAACWAPCGVC